MFTQLAEAYGNDRRVVLIALKTDGGGAAGAKAYFRGKSDPSPWIIGSDNGEAYYQKVIGGQRQLYRYAIIKPDGTIGEKGQAGRFRSGPGGKKQFSLVSKKIGDTYGQKASVLLKGDKKYRKEFFRTILIAELGMYKQAFLSVASLMKTADLKSDALALRDDILKSLENKVDELAKIIEKDDVETRYPAFQQLNNIARDLSRESCGKKAKKVLKTISNSAWIRKEQKAEQAYKSLKRKGEKLTPEQMDKILKPAFRKLSEAYKDTYFGNLAGKE